MSRFRISSCVLLALFGLYCLYAALWYGWLTVAGEPSCTELYRLLFIVYMGLLPIIYVLYIIALRPKNLWLFLLNTFVTAVWFFSIPVGNAPVWGRAVFAAASVYLLWRSVCYVKRVDRKKP